MTKLIGIIVAVAGGYLVLSKTDIVLGLICLIGGLVILGGGIGFHL